MPDTCGSLGAPRLISRAPLGTGKRMGSQAGPNDALGVPETRAVVLGCGLAPEGKVGAKGAGSLG